MIVEVITDKYGNEISCRNIFNATLEELKPGKEKMKYIDKVDDRGRFGFIVYRMNGDIVSYTH